MTKGWVPIVLIAAIPFAFAGEQVDETRDATSDGFVRVTVVRGELMIEGWDRNEIQVRGELDDETREFIFDVAGDEAVIEVKLPQHLSRWNSRGATTDLTIKVPAGSSVDASGISTDIRVVNITGSVELGGVSGDFDLSHIGDRLDATTVSGDMDVRDAAGRISLKSVSGDINVSRGKGDFRLHSVSGDLFGRELEGEFDVETVSGDIELVDTELTSLRGHTVSGDVDLSTAIARGGNIELDSVSGSVRIDFAGSVSARFDLETASGSIRNRLSDDKPKSSKYVRDQTLRFALGDGDGEVIIGTRSGSIVIGRD